MLFIEVIAVPDNPVIEWVSPSLATYNVFGGVLKTLEAVTLTSKTLKVPDKGTDPSPVNNKANTILFVPDGKGIFTVFTETFALRFKLWKLAFSLPTTIPNLLPPPAAITSSWYLKLKILKNTDSYWIKRKKKIS